MSWLEIEVTVMIKIKITGNQKKNIKMKTRI